MNFTYNTYRNMIKNLSNHGYIFSAYDNYFENEKSVIMRHDIDFSLEKSVEMAKLEKKLGVKSTYFVLLSSDFYNVASKKSVELIKKIKSYGHEIGLHFDEVKYHDCHAIIPELIKYEAKLLQQTIDMPIATVSMHRPSHYTLKANYKIDGIINSYGADFCNETMKYVSDSRRRWRENIDEIIQSEKYPRLHILTHAFWYNDMEKDIKTSIKDFIDESKAQRYESLNDNITDLEDILKE